MLKVGRTLTSNRKAKVMINRESNVAILQHWQQTTGEVRAYEAIDHHPNVFTVITERGERFILKRVDDIEHSARVESQLRVLRHLHACQVPVAVPILADDQLPFVQHGGSVYTLSPVLRVSHEDWVHIPAEQLYLNLGRALARLHRALASYPGEILSWQMDFTHRALGEAVPVIQRHLDSPKAAIFDKVLCDVEPGIRAALADLPVQYIHGDCHGGNIVLDNGDVSGFIDLDHLPYAPRIYDVSYLLADRVKSHIERPAELQAWLGYFDRFLVGYEQVQPLTAAEKRAIWVGMLAVQMIFVDWFFTHNEQAAAEKNLVVFYWIYEHKNTIETRLTGNSTGKEEL
jgi:Ser/Thr protein kinase RdoA (MazF antagonist)